MGGKWCRRAIVLLFTLAVVSPSGAENTDELIRAEVDRYIERYLVTRPVDATGAGDHRYDGWLDDWTEPALEGWIELNERTVTRLQDLLGRENAALSPRYRLDAEVLADQARRTLFELKVRRRPWRDPLFWSQALGRNAVLLLVRDSRPLAERLRAVASRTEQIPRLCRQAREALDTSADGELAAELLVMAVGQLRSSASFYRHDLKRIAGALPESLRAPMAGRLQATGARAADALESLGDHWQERSRQAGADPRLGNLYAESFRLSTHHEEPIGEILAAAEKDFGELLQAAAEHCRGLWPNMQGERGEPPADRHGLVRRCFSWLSRDVSASSEAFVDEYRVLSEQARSFVEDRGLATVPRQLRVLVSASPPHLAGQSVGGLFPAGPLAPDEPTLLFVPSPPRGPQEMIEAFFRDFNQHFAVMITPHETYPGHALQAAVAGRQPWLVRTLFPDPVYVEGWGTFSERLMLDHGWGDRLARVAHLKKQLENAARLIVDIRVHTEGMSRDEVIAFVRDEALQDEQFAANMWQRALTSSPQITSYHLGYRQIQALYQDVRRQQGDAFDPRRFTDRMFSLGAVPVKHYRRLLLEPAAEPAGINRP